MVTIDQIWQYIDANVPFYVYLNDGRKFFVKDRTWIGAHPSRKSSSVTIYGPAHEEEHFVPLHAISSMSHD
jgi:hypothetical protein